jgi:hypothetical protein
MKYVAARDTLAIPPEISVEAVVGIGAIPQGFGLEVERALHCQVWPTARPSLGSTKLILSVRTRTPRGATSPRNWCSCHPTHHCAMQRRMGMQTKNFHWHMHGRHFWDYHLLLDEQSANLFAMTDII